MTGVQTCALPISGSEALLKPAKFGVLKLELFPDSYTLSFIGANGAVLDGPVTTACH